MALCSVVYTCPLNVFATGSRCEGGTASLYYSGTFGISHYGNGTRCSWRLHSRPGERVFITFTSFATELGYDFIDVRDAVYPTNLIGRFSGSQIPPIVVSCGSSVTVTFNSDSIISDYGFLAFFKSNGKKWTLGEWLIHACDRRVGPFL